MKYNAITDRLLASKNALRNKLDNTINYVTYRDDGKIDSFNLEAYEADQEALRVFRQELDVLGVHSSRSEILAARRYYDSLTASQLFECYEHRKGQGRDDAQGDFAEYLVQSAYESWYCQAYDC